MSGMKWIVEKVNIRQKTDVLRRYGLCVLAHVPAPPPGSIRRVTCQTIPNRSSAAGKRVFVQV
jgi:hypothetical protein